MDQFSTVFMEVNNSMVFCAIVMDECDEELGCGASVVMCVGGGDDWSRDDYIVSNSFRWWWLWMVCE